MVANADISGPGVFYWRRAHSPAPNFGDRLSLELVRRITGRDDLPAHEAGAPAGPRLLAIGSILHYAREGDCIWGTGVNGRHLDARQYRFSSVEICAVRGPLTAEFVRRELRLR